MNEDKSSGGCKYDKANLILRIIYIFLFLFNMFKLVN